MLVLARKSNESLIIDGRIIVRVVKVEGDSVKIGIEAPRDVPIFRSEVYEEIQNSNKVALTKTKMRMPNLKPQGPQAGDKDVKKQS